MTAERVEKAEAVAVQLSEEEALPVLRDGDVIGGQQIPWSSNYTFLLRIDAGPGRFLRAVYKPKAGERPLYDFPGGTLYRREYAAYLLGRAIGWPPVPLTLIREGPYGVGSMQLYVDSDPRITYFDLVSDHADEFGRFAAFDLVANNADRKGGHCLLGADGTIWSIDHGLTFHPDFKVRTVMLEFWGAPSAGGPAARPPAPSPTGSPPRTACAMSCASCCQPMRSTCCCAALRPCWTIPSSPASTPAETCPGRWSRQRARSFS